MEELDVLITSSRIVDGAGNPWYRGDVGIVNGRISAIDSKLKVDAKLVINARDKIVSPGFIDIHTHSDFILPLPNGSEIMEAKVRQGVTTEVMGNCGYSPAPVNPDTLPLMDAYTGFLQAEKLAWKWQTFAEFLDYLDKLGVPVNAVPLVGHGAIRIAQMGFDAGDPTKEDMEAMKALVGECMEGGAFGMSTGLIYPPGMFTSTEELTELAKVVAAHGGVYASHLRGESETLINSMKEVISVAENAGVPTESSHHECYGKDYWGKEKETLKMFNDARERGVDITYDVFPYTTANTTMLAIYPPWALAGGVDALIGRLKDPATREKVKHDLYHQFSDEWPPEWPHNLAARTGWENVYIIWCGSKKNKELEGLTAEEYAKKVGKEDPFDAISDLVIEENGAVTGLYDGCSGVVEKPGRKEEETTLVNIMKNPIASLESDAIFTGEKGTPAPHCYGTFPRVLGRYVRERGVLRLEDAVRKITSLPARRFQLHDRGLLAPGFAGDVTIFDADTVADRATIKDPRQYPVGIEWVLVNGTVVWDGKEYDEKAKSGKVIRHASTA